MTYKINESKTCHCLVLANPRRMLAATHKIMQRSAVMIGSMDQRSSTSSSTINMPLPTLWNTCHFGKRWVPGFQSKHSAIEAVPDLVLQLKEPNHYERNPRKLNIGPENETLWVAKSKTWSELSATSSFSSLTATSRRRRANLKVKSATSSSTTASAIKT